MQQTNKRSFVQQIVPTANLGALVMFIALFVVVGLTVSVPINGAASTVHHPQLSPVRQASNGMPTAVSYQGCLMDSAGEAVNGTVDITLKLYAQPVGGTALWSETHRDVAVVECEFNLTAGSLTPIPATVWNSEPLYVGTTIGGEAEMTPREALHPVRVPEVDVPMIQSGRVADNGDNPSWTLGGGVDGREYVIRVEFLEPFESVPTVQTQLGTIDAQSHDRVVRIGVNARNVSRTGFDFVVGTWHDSIVYGFEGTWVAHD